MTNTASGKVVRRLLGGAIPQDAVAGLEESLALASTDGLRVANGVTADYTLVLGDLGKAVDVNSATAKALTVPPNSAVAFPLGALIEVHQVGAGAVSLTAGVGVTLEGSTTTPSQGSSLLLRKRATNTWTVTELARSGTYVPTNPVIVVLTQNSDGDWLTWTEAGVACSATYDPATGNMATLTVAGVTRTFTYDAEDNLIGAA